MLGLPSFTFKVNGHSVNKRNKMAPEKNIFRKLLIMIRPSLAQRFVDIILAMFSSRGIKPSPSLISLIVYFPHQLGVLCAKYGFSTLASTLAFHRTCSNLKQSPTPREHLYCSTIPLRGYYGRICSCCISTSSSFSDTINIQIT